PAGDPGSPTNACGSGGNLQEVTAGRVGRGGVIHGFPPPWCAGGRQGGGRGGVVAPVGRRGWPVRCAPPDQPPGGARLTWCRRRLTPSMTSASDRLSSSGYPHSGSRSPTDEISCLTSGRP